MHPATAEHRRDDVDFRELLGLELEWVAIEHDEVSQETGEELPAPMFVPREPGGIDYCRLECLVEREPLFGVPRLAVVDRPQDAGADARPRV